MRLVSAHAHVDCRQAHAFQNAKLSSGRGLPASSRDERDECQTHTRQQNSSSARLGHAIPKSRRLVVFYSSRSTWLKRSSVKFGTHTRCVRFRADKPSCSSAFIWCTKSPRRRHSTCCGNMGGAWRSLIARSPPSITSCPP